MHAYYPLPTPTKGVSGLVTQPDMMLRVVCARHGESQQCCAMDDATSVGVGINRGLAHWLLCLQEELRYRQGGRRDDN